MTGERAHGSAAVYPTLSEIIADIDELAGSGL
jgi:hypothetical protein